MDEFLTNLDTQGIHLCSGFLSDEKCDRLRALLEGLPEDELVHNEVRDFHGKHTSLTPNILIHTSEFIDLAQEPRILEVE